jgi:N-acetylglucosaminyldiphosphoundecaprenol N-acetyl-beta-D-mannosaminyltransferase
MKVMASEQIPTAFLIERGGKKYLGIFPEALEIQAINEYVSAQENVSLQVAQVGDIFRFGTLTKKQQSTIASHWISELELVIPAKKPQYFTQDLFTHAVTLRLPHTDVEQSFIATMGRPLITFGYREDTNIFNVVEGYSLTNGTSGKIDLLSSVPNTIVENDATKAFIADYNQVREDFLFSWKNKYPLFRQKYINIFPGTRAEAVNLIINRLERRFQEQRSGKTVVPMSVVTPNLDHLRMLIEENDSEFQEVYAEAFLQSADGYPPLVKHAKKSIGYQTIEQVSGVDLFVSLMNKIGQESLPFTIYFVGGFQQTGQKVRDHFVGSYPHMAKNIVGISAPPVGFMKNDSVYSAIKEDITKKNPDLIFACLSAPTQEKFIHRLKKEGVPFGLGFGLGRTFDLIAGYQKKEPKFIEDLRLVWLYRAFSNKTYAKRVPKDLLFAIKTLLTA